MQVLDAPDDRQEAIGMNDVERERSLTPSLLGAESDKEAELRAYAHALKAERDAMQAATRDRVPGEQKKTAERRRSTTDIPPHLQDLFLEHTKSIVEDPVQRERHFPDPVAVRRVRVWAGEDLVGHEIKPTIDAALPPWAESHRPFQEWQDPVSVSAVRL